MTTHGIVRSLVWKDYRELRLFWLAALLFTIVLEILAGLMVTRLGMVEYTVLPSLAFALVTPGLYALGCAAMMFAGEHESGMYHLLRALPVDPRRLLLGRAFFVLASTLLMLVATCGAFLIIQRMMEIETGSASTIFGLFAIVPLELFAWGVLMSLVCRRPLSALMLGGIFCTWAIWAGCMVGAWTYEILGHKVSDPDWWPAALVFRLLVVFLVMAIDLRLAARWFHDGGVLRHRKRPGSTTTAKTQPSAGSRRHSLTTKATTELGRLLWQQWRQSRRLVGVFALATLLVGSLFVFSQRSHNDPEDPGALLMLLLVPLAGVCAFREDWREGRYRFLTHCGARPGRVWWTRQLVWLGASVVILLVALVLYGISISEQLNDARPIRYDEICTTPAGGLVKCFTFLFSLFLGIEPEQVSIVYILFLVLPTLAMLTGYACGQFCSIYTRSTIVASMGSFGLIYLVAIWISVMTALWIDWLWSVVPIPFVLLLATRLRMRDWMLERTDWRARSRSVLVPMVPLLAILVAVPFYRVYSVPKVTLDMPIAVAKPRPTKDELATAKLYQKAYATYVPLMQEDDYNHFSNRQSDLEEYLWPGNKYIFDQHPLPQIYVERLKANQKTIDAVLLASRRPECAFREADDTSWIILPGHVQDLGWLLAASARHLTVQGKLDEALERYLAAMHVANHLNQEETKWYRDRLNEFIEWGLLCWAAHPNQTVERIEYAFKQFNELHSPPASLALDIIQDWRQNRMLLMEIDSWHGPNFKSAKDSGKAFGKYVKATILKWFPWERARALRVVDYFAHHELEKIRTVESALTEGRSAAFDVDDRPSMEAMRESTFLGHARPWLIGYRLRELVWNTARERAFRLQMALAAWRQEHGDVPESLDELVGKYLDAVPVDPFTGKVFHYIPEGVPRSVIEKDEKQHPMETISPNGVKLANRYPVDGLGPFIWSPGWLGIDYPDFKAEWKSLDKQDQKDASARWKVLRKGRIFPVP